MERNDVNQDGERMRDARERAELERITGDEFMDRPDDAQQAASDDAPLPDDPRPAE